MDRREKGQGGEKEKRKDDEGDTGRKEEIGFRRTKDDYKKESRTENQKDAISEHREIINCREEKGKQGTKLKKGTMYKQNIM